MPHDVSLYINNPIARLSKANKMSSTRCVGRTGQLNQNGNVELVLRNVSLHL